MCLPLVTFLGRGIAPRVGRPPCSGYGSRGSGGTSGTEGGCGAWPEIVFGRFVKTSGQARSLLYVKT